jgi:hypothetical protein
MPTNPKWARYDAQRAARRLNITLLPEVRETAERLRAELGCATLSELFAWLVQERWEKLRPK